MYPEESSFYNNLKALQKMDPALEIRVAAHKADPAWELLHTACGFYTACRHGEDGRRIHTNSLIEPVKEGEEWHAHTGKGDCTFVMLGLGLGYHAVSFLEKKPRHESIIIVEAKMDLFIMALFVHDMVPLISDPGISFLVGDNYIDLEKTLLRFCTPPFDYARFLPVTEIDRAYYDKACDVLEEILFVYRTKCQREQLLHHGVGQFIDFLTG